MLRPFRGEVGPAVLVHCGHHKVGTTWFGSVLADVAAHFGFVFQIVPFHRGTLGSDIAEAPENKKPEEVRADVIQFIHARDFDESILGDRRFRGSHLIRDPRDVAVSGYHYHRWATERWVHTPNAAFRGLSYQQYLNSLPEPEGLLVEIQRTCATIVRDMSVWDYDREEFLELRYEDLIKDEDAGFARLFAHYGFKERAIASGVEVARRHSFTAKTGRAMGDVGASDHLRSGLPGQWRNEFRDEHVTLFKSLANDTLIRLGYEEDDTWTFDRGSEGTGFDSTQSSSREN